MRASFLTPNDEIERRGAAPTTNEADLSQSSTSSFGLPKTRPRSLQPIVRPNYLPNQKNNSDAPIIVTPSAIFLQLHEYRNRIRPTANSGAATTTSTFFGRGLRCHLSRRTWRSAKNACTEPNCCARSSSNAVVCAGKPQLAQESVPPGEL